MMTNKSLILAASLLLAAGVTTGCSSASKTEQPTARAKVSVSSAAVIADLQSIKLTVTDNGVAPTFSTPIEVFLSKAPAGNVWTGNISQIPANPTPGSVRLFKAEAFDGANGTGVKRYEGQGTAIVIAGSTAEVTILLQELNVPPGPTNYAPVITLLTSSASYVLPGQAGSSTVVANDPDNNGNPLVYEWVANCTAGTMSFGTPTAATTTWTAPAVNSVCTVAVKVSETTIAQPLSVTTYFTITVDANFGNANVAAFPNSYPIVTVRGDFKYNFFSDVTTIPVGQQGNLSFTATDPDGDNVRFDLSLRCKDDTAVPPIPYTTQTGFFSAATFTTTTGGSVAPPAPSAFTFNPTFGTPQPAVPVYVNPYADCEFKVTVQDLCTAGNCGPAGAQGSLADGSDKVTDIGGTPVKSVTTGFINATHPAKAKRAPVIVRTIAPNQLGGTATGVQTWDPQKVAIVQPGTTYLLQAEADDRYEGGTLLPSYNCVNGTFAAGPINTGNLKTSLNWTSPATLTVGMNCTISFQSTGPTGSTLTTVATFKFASSDPCVGQADGTACSDGNACTTGDHCFGGNCTGTAATCNTPPNSGVCYNATGTCNPLDGSCSYQPSGNGTACSDGNACTTGDLCNGAGACTPGTPTTCVASGQCFAAGVCNPANGICSNPPALAGTACNDGNLCNTGDTCNGAGVCQAGPNVVSCAVGPCVLTAGTCNPATGACQGGINVADGTACPTDNNACTTDACQAGVCAHTAISCTASQRPTCDPVLGCQETTLAHASLQSLDMSRIDGVNASGTSSYLSGTGVFNPAKTILGATLSGAGASDSFLAKFNMTTGALVWAKVYGDNLDQFGAANTAETADGTVAVVGRVAPAGRVGECVASSAVPPVITCTGVVVSNAGGNEADFLLLVNASTGAVKLGSQVIDNGLSGKIIAVAANPTLNRIAVCGVVSATSSLCRTPGASADSCTAATAYQSGTDLLVAMFDTTGSLLWARQVGGTSGVTSDESCNSVAIDTDGTVFVAGKYMENLNLGGSSSALPALPNLTSTRHMFVAHFSTTGATLAAQAFGTPANRCAGNPVLACTVATAATDCAGLTPATCTTAPVGNVTPNDLQLDPSGNPVVAGSFTASFPISGLVSPGGTDAFVAKITPSLTPTWGVRLGNSGNDAANRVAFGPGGNVIAVGSYSAIVAGTPTTGAAALPAPSGTAAQAFIMKLDSATGATHFAGGYGDAAVQQGTGVAISGTRVQWTGSYLGTLDIGGGLTLTNPGISGLGFEAFSNIQ